MDAPENLGQNPSTSVIRILGPSETLSGILSGILPDLLSGIPSGMLHGIPSDTWHAIWHPIWHLFWHFLWAAGASTWLATGGPGVPTLGHDQLMRSGQTLRDADHDHEFSCICDIKG